MGLKLTLLEFQHTEWRRLREAGATVRNAGRFHGAMNQVIRAYDFLETIAARIQVDSIEMNQHWQPVLEWSLLVTESIATIPPVIQERMAAYDFARNRFELDTDSMYLFAKILLGNAAQLVELYFGPARACSLRSHDKLRKCFEKFATTKNLVDAEPMLRIAKLVHDEIVEYRDKQIEHINQRDNPHIVRGIIPDGNGGFTIQQSPSLVPDLTRPLPFATTRPVSTMLEFIDTWLKTLMELIQNNSDKTYLSPHGFISSPPSGG